MSAISAALIIADKTDVRYTRVRKAEFAAFDIHDRVNFAVREASTIIDDAHENSYPYNDDRYAVLLRYGLF